MPQLRKLPISPVALRRLVHTNPQSAQEAPKHSSAEHNTNSIVPPTDTLGSGLGSKGRTGGGPALGSTAPGAPTPPKVLNSRVSGIDAQRNLTPEQQREVEEHNREFAKNHEIGESSAYVQKVDEKFWKSGSKN